MNPYAFYLPEDAAFTVIDSALESVRFLFAVSDRDAAGDLFCRSIDATPDGLAPYRGRFMEGVGYCADSIFFSAHMLVRLGRVLERDEFETAGFSYLSHALNAGFFDDAARPLKLYRDTETGELLDNLEAHEGYLELGHIARVSTHLLRIAALDTDPDRAERCRAIASRTAEWLLTTQRCDNGWYPRRCSPEGEVFPYAANAFGPGGSRRYRKAGSHLGSERAGTFVLELLAAVSREGLVEATDVVRRDVGTFVAAGGFFGSTNTDTEDLEENVSYAIAFQTLLDVSDLLEDQEMAGFALDHCLRPLERFELTDDLNGVETKGLLYMEDAWNAACTWEMAEVAQAYLLAFGRDERQTYALKALTILRGMAKHHHGDLGFLTEAVDWDGHSTSARHFPGERYGDIITTHPFLNNLHVLQPTVTYLERFAMKIDGEVGDAFYDLEGNRLCGLPLGAEAWMSP